MSELEDLRLRKEQLILERDIHRLEKRKNFQTSVQKWSWWWVAPLAVVGLYFLLFVFVFLGKGRAMDSFMALAISIPGITPLIMKARARWVS